MSHRIFIIHGWGGHPEEGWFPWLKRELKKKGFEVHVPAMPETNNPTIDVWVSYLSKIIRNVDEKTILVGHSIGCQTILRYIEQLKDGQKIEGVVFVAGWFTLMNLNKEEKSIAAPWLTTPIDIKLVKTHCRKFIAIFSDDDSVVPFDNKEKFKQQLGAEIILEHAKKHFSGDDGIMELPSVLESVLTISSNDSNH